VGEAWGGCKTYEWWTPSRKIREYWENGTIPWVKSGELEDNVIYTTEEKITERGLKESSAKVFPKGTLLVALYGATVGKTAILGIEATTNQAVCAVLPPSEREAEWDAKYLQYYFIAVRPMLISKSGGGAQPNIYLHTLRRLEVPLPPLSEQKRIVAKLDELNKHIEEAKRLAREAREEAERLMASALHEVFSKAEEKGWEWTTIGKVSKEMKPGFARNKKHISEDGVPHLRPNNIDVGYLNLKKVVKVKLDEKINIQEYYLKKGDVLFNNTNSFELVGRAALVTEDLKWGYSNHITRIRVKREVILSEWLTLAINYLWMQGYFQEVCTRWVGQAGVNMNTLAKTRIPLPPLEEQKRIVAYLDSIHERAQRLVKLYEEREKELEKLFPAILDRAFRGEL